MRQAYKHIPLILLVFLIGFSPNTSKLTAKNFELEYELVQKKYENAEAKMTQKLRKKIRDAKHSTHVQLSQEQIQIKKEFDDVKAAEQYFDSIRDLRNELNKMYTINKNISVDKKKLNQETTMLALEIFSKTEKLKQQYRSFALPIMHNMMIDLGMRKRGACKDWAEDLLHHVIPLERQFFQVTWGEANPKKITEHNVLVIYPKHAEFKDGLVIDPWRTSGKVFWIYTTKDRHYKWQPWKNFGVY